MKTFLDEVTRETENWEETAQTSKTFLDEFIREKENCEEMAKTSKTFCDEDILKVENWKENSKTINTFHDKVIPETENWEENVAIRKTFFLKESYMLTSEKNCVLLDLHCFIICSLRNSHQTSTDYNLDVSENYQYLLLCLT